MNYFCLSNEQISSRAGENKRKNGVEFTRGPKWKKKRKIWVIMKNDERALETAAQTAVSLNILSAFSTFSISLFNQSKACYFILLPINLLSENDVHTSLTHTFDLAPFLTQVSHLALSRWSLFTVDLALTLLLFHCRFGSLSRIWPCSLFTVDLVLSCRGYLPLICSLYLFMVVSLSRLLLSFVEVSRFRPEPRPQFHSISASRLHTNS